MRKIVYVKEVKPLVHNSTIQNVLFNAFICELCIALTLYYWDVKGLKLIYLCVHCIFVDNTERLHMEGIS